MKYDNAALILATVKIECPLCDKYYRQKFNLRSHIKNKHTNYDFDKYIRKFID